MSKLNDILTLVRSINEDEFKEQLTTGDSLDDLHTELLYLADKIKSRKDRTNVIIDHIAERYDGDYFKNLPISDEQDELDVVCLGINTYMDELKAATVSKKILEEKNQSLIEEKDRSEQLAKAKDQFMSSMSHEIRTPLNGILGFTDVMLKNSDLDPESIKQLNYIKMLGDTLRVIIDDILDLAKIESGEISLHKSPFNLAVLTQLINDTFTIKTDEKQIEFGISVDQNLPSNFIGDSTRISQILYNLVSNAVKFTPAKGKVGLRICLDRKENGYHYIQMIVKDTGIGIPPESIDNIFDPFIQVSNDTARQYGGTGLGLSIVKKIITIMNGEISVSSEVGKGTTFTVTIPLMETVAESLAINQDTNKKGSPVILPLDKKIKVLLAEDNRINQILAQKILSGFEFDHVTVDNGRMAVEAVEKEDFDVVLMDLMMPEMDGYQATTAIRNMSDNRKKNIPIIALTALVVDSVTDKCAAIGVDRYLSKPFKSDDLYEKIIDSVREKQMLA